MNLHSCYLTESDCYKRGRTISPKGVMVHSTGANNPYLKRYVQPDDGLLGVNANGNDWNRTGVTTCVHAFIGRLSDGDVATYQTLPWDRRAWHAGGAANDTHISFEICEDNLENPDYFALVWREAVELTAMLCSLYSLDPLEDGVVIDHSEGAARGIATAHGDITHWLKLYGKTMVDFRAEVAKEMNDVTEERVREIVMEILRGENTTVSKTLAPELAEAVEKGITDGTRPGGYATRAQVAVMALRASKE